MAGDPVAGERFLAWLSEMKSAFSRAAEAMDLFSTLLAHSLRIHQLLKCPCFYA
jgi:hypothetical protein